MHRRSRRICWKSAPIRTWDLGREQLAYEQAQQCLQIDRANITALNVLGTIEGMRGNYVESERYFRGALSFYPQNTIARNNLELTLRNKQSAPTAARKP